MPQHTVKQGEHVTRIAHEHGFGGHRPVYEHPENAELRENRPDPNILFPGDLVFVPEKELKDESGATEQRHHFRLEKDTLRLRVRLLKLDWEADADRPCDLDGAGPAREHVTDAEGLVEQKIAPPVEHVSLSFETVPALLERMLPVKVGHLDPIVERSGQAGRLRNLGYYRGEVPVEDETAFRSAVEEFQCDHKLTVDGLCGPNTQSKLKDVYGC